MKLTKKVKDFLIDWLSDALDLAVMNRDTSSLPGSLLNNLKNILKKLKNENKRS